jgi:small-conductance mechanosensitive channel
MNAPVSSTPVHNLVEALLADLSDVHLMVQGCIIVAALALGWFTSRQIEQRLPDSVRDAWHAREWRRFAVPLVSLLLILVARPILLHWHSVPLLNLALPLLMSMFTIQFTFFLLRSLFQPGAGLRAIERTVSWVIWGVVALHITGYLDSVVSALDAIGFDVGKQHISVYTAFLGLASVAMTLVLALSVGRLVERRLIAGSNLDTNHKVALNKLVRALFLVMAILIALPLVGIDITVLSVFGGALGVGLGLGLQKIASNYVSGFTLLLDNSIRIGDMVTVNDRFGEVTQIATRYTVLRGLDGTETIIPNESMITGAVINHSLSNPNNLVIIPFLVDYRSDLRNAETIILEAATGHARVLKEQAPAVRLMNFGDNGIELRLFLWIADPEDGQAQLISDINWRVWDGFQRAGIEIPYPQRVVHLARATALPESA